MRTIETVATRTTPSSRSVMSTEYPSHFMCSAAAVSIAIGPWWRNWIFHIGQFGQSVSKLHLFEHVLLAIPFVRLTLHLSFVLPEPSTRKTVQWSPLDRSQDPFK